MYCIDQGNSVLDWLTAIGTCGAVFVAVFNSRIIDWLARGKLSADIANPKGEETTLIEITNPNGPIRSIPWYKPKRGHSVIISNLGNYGTAGNGGVPGTQSVTIASYHGGAGLQAGNIPSGQSGSSDIEILLFHIRVKNEKKRTDIKRCRVLLKEVWLKNKSSNQFELLKLTVPPQFCWAPAEISEKSIDIVTYDILDFGFIEKGSQQFTLTLISMSNNFSGNLEPGNTMKYTIEILSNNIRPKHYDIEVFWDGVWPCGDDFDKHFQINCQRTPRKQLKN